MQTNENCVLKNVILPHDTFDFTICNPPFFDLVSERKAKYGKVRTHHDLEESTQGGEMMFLQKYAQESLNFKDQIKWFTTLCGKQSTCKFMKTYLEEMVSGLKIIIQESILLGETKRWIIAWKFI